MFAAAGGGRPGQRSVVSGQRVRGTPLPRASTCPAPSAHAQLAASPPARPWPSRSLGSGITLVLVMSCCADCGGGGALRVGGPGPARGGDLGRRSAPTPPCSLSGVRGPACRESGHCRRVWPSPAPLLAWGLGIRRRRVPRAVAPVADGDGQGLGWPEIGLLVFGAEYRPPFRESGPWGHPAGIMAWRTLSWSSRATPYPGGTSRFPPSLCSGTALKGRFLNPLEVSEVAHFSDPYTSITKKRASPPRGSQSRAQSLPSSAGCGPPTAPPAGSARGSCASRAGSAPDPRAAGAAAICAAGVGSCRPSRCRRGGGLAGGLGWLGGDQVPHDGVDIVDWLLVVVAVVRRHLIDTRGDARYRLDLWLRGCPAPLPLSSALPFPPVPAPRPACPWWTTSPSPSLPLDRLPAPSPWLWCAPSRLPPCPCLVSLPLSLAPLPFPLAPAPFPCPCPCPLPCPASLRPQPVPLPVPCACPLPLLLALASCPRPCSLLSPPAPRLCPGVCPPGLLPAPAPSPGTCPPPPRTDLPLSPSAPRQASPRLAPCPARSCPPPFLDHAPLQLRQPDAGRRALGRRGADGPQPPLREGGLGRVRLGGAGMDVAGLSVGAVPGALLPSAAALAVPSEAPGARTGPVLGAGSVPGAVAWLAGAAAVNPGASGIPLGGGAAGVAGWTAGAASPAGTGSRAGGSGSLRAPWGRSAGGPTGTAAFASCCSSRPARISPPPPEETGEQERGTQWWRSSRWGEPSESDISGILVGMRGCRRSVGRGPWAVPCDAGGGMVWYGMPCIQSGRRAAPSRSPCLGPESGISWP